MSHSKFKCIAIIGLGYIGTALASEFAKVAKVIGYDIKNSRNINPEIIINDWKTFFSCQTGLYITNQQEKLAEADIYIVAVQTPVSKKEPDLHFLISAAKTVACYLHKGSLVVFESTVYPGAIENICIPVLENGSQLKCFEDFDVGYSPERINPGDTTNNLVNTVKIIASNTSKALEAMNALYSMIMPGHIYQTSNIKTAEMIKIVENCQRDINIAFLNEISILASRLEIDMKEVLDGMRTKWNHLDFKPGLVGGTCIKVNPYYLMYAAKKVGITLDLTETSRRINEKIPGYIAEIIKETVPVGGQIGIIGITYKPNSVEWTSSEILILADVLRKMGYRMSLFDPIVNQTEFKQICHTELKLLSTFVNMDCIIYAVGHKCLEDLCEKQFINMLSKTSESRVLFDLTGRLQKQEIEKEGVTFFRL